MERIRLSKGRLVECGEQEKREETRKEVKRVGKVVVIVAKR